MKKNYTTFQRSTNIMGKLTDAEAKSQAYKKQRVYALAQATKGEDRVTKKDLEYAEEGLKGYDILSASARDEAKVKKPIKAVAGVLAGLAAGVAPGVIGLGYLAKKKMKKTSAVAEPNDDKYSMNNKKPIMDLYQKTVKQNTANMYTGGEVEVTKGGDYIKDLID